MRSAQAQAHGRHRRCCVLMSTLASRRRCLPDRTAAAGLIPLQSGPWALPVWAFLPCAHHWAEKAEPWEPPAPQSRDADRAMDSWSRRADSSSLHATPTGLAVPVSMSVTLTFVA